VGPLRRGVGTVGLAAVPVVAGYAALTASPSLAALLIGFPAAVVALALAPLALVAAADRRLRGRAVVPRTGGLLGAALLCWGLVALGPAGLAVAAGTALALAARE
jgi:hypothetical protein